MSYCDPQLELRLAWVPHSLALDARSGEEMRGKALLVAFSLARCWVLAQWRHLSCRRYWRTRSQEGRQQGKREAGGSDAGKGRLNLAIDRGSLRP